MDKEEAGAASPKNWKIEEIRCIAVIMVISAHFSLMTRIFWEHYQIPFYLGAELFLVISGYFIGIKIKKERFSLLSYLKKRILKIYPPLIVLIAAAWEVNSICSQLSYIDPNLYCDAESFVGASLDILLCNYWGNHRYYVFSHLWYIKVLMWAYIFMAVLGKCFNFFGKKKAKYLGVCFGIAAVFFICVRSFMLIGVNFRGGVLEVILGSKIDFLFIGCFCALLPEKIKILVSKRRMINAYVLVPAALIINTYTDSLSPLQMGRTLNSFGYLCAMVCYGLAVTAASQERNYTLPAVMRWFASRSYYLYVFNFIALVLTWLVIYYIYPNIFYINSYYYQIAQVILGMGILAAMAEFFYRIFERGK